MWRRNPGVAGERERLRQIIKELQRHRFGRRQRRCLKIRCCWAWKMSSRWQRTAETAQDLSAPDGPEARARKRCGNRGALPAHLPRIEVVVDIEDKICPCWQGELHRIGEYRSERLDLVPAQFCYSVSQIRLPCLRGRCPCRRRPRLG
nr:IS66 family transposase zinc-finger binding domain-containing protein [Bradyrhizobium macuxiense]